MKFNLSDMFSLFDVIVAFTLGLLIGTFYGFISFALCAIKREESFKYEEGLFD